MAVGAVFPMIAVADLLAAGRRRRWTPRSSRATEHIHYQNDNDTQRVPDSVRSSASSTGSTSSMASTECKLSKAAFHVDHSLYSYTNDNNNTLEGRNKRKIELTKPRNCDFGAALVCFDTHVFVAMVHKHVIKAGHRILSPAYMHGLRVGDEVVLINDTDAASLAAEGCEKALYRANVVSIKVFEQPGVRVFRFAVPDALRFSLVDLSPEDVLGIRYTKGRVYSVQQGSLADDMGMRTGCTITSVAGKSVLNFSDEEVLGALERALYSGESEVPIHTIPGGLADAIKTGARAALDLVAPTVSVAEAINSDFEFVALPLPKKKDRVLLDA